MCWHCQSEVCGEYFCGRCVKVQPLSKELDYFTYMNLPRKLILDEKSLEETFYSLSRTFHPDFYDNKDEGESLVVEPSEPRNPYSDYIEPKERRAERKANVEMLLRILDGNSSNPNLDVFKHVKCELMSKKLNTVKKDHDFIFIKPHHKTIGQAEVKAMATLQQSGEITSALNQLEGGKEEMLRAHGHLLDSDWSYLGIICLPNLVSRHCSFPI